VDRRPLTTADLPALTETLNAAEAADDLPVRTPADELEDQLTEEDLDLAADSIGLFDGDGGCVAFGWSRLRDQPSPEGRWATLTAAVHPARTRQGHGSWLLDHLLARAEAQLATAPPEPTRYVDAYVQAGQHTAQRLLSSRGFTAMRWYDELTVDLRDGGDGRRDPAPLAPDVALRGWDPTRSQEAKGVHRGAFADHWGSSPISEQRWQRLTAEPRFQPDLSTIAVRVLPDGSDVVIGMVLATLWPEDWPVTGREEAWIDVVATARPHRGTGVATAMLGRTLAAARARGLTHATLGVDSDNPTGAHRLYTGLGFAPTSQLQKWARPLVSG
jgi:mycothiol synthase